MRVDLTQIFRNAGGKPTIAPDTERPVTLKYALIQALLVEHGPNGEAMTPKEKSARYVLYRFLEKAGDTVDLAEDEIALLKRAVAAFPTLTFGQCMEFLGHVWERGSAALPAETFEQDEEQPSQGRRH
jgi:hypothetical protein